MAEPRLRPDTPTGIYELARAYGDIALGYHQRLPGLEASVGELGKLVQSAEAATQRVEAKLEELVESLEERTERTLERHELEELRARNTKIWDVAKIVLAAVIVAALGVMGGALFATRAHGAPPPATTVYAKP